MHFENWISYRYMTACKGRFLTFLNVISVAGVAIGVMSLIVVIGVMSGFGNNLREKIIGTSPHIMFEKETGVANYSQVEKDLLSVEGVVAASAYVQGNVFLESSGRALGLVVRGINPQSENPITKVNEYLKQGKVTDLGNRKVIIGKELARYFGYSVGDKITLISPGAGIAKQEWRYVFEIAGIFGTGMADYDMNLILVDIKDAQTIFNLDDTVASGIGIKVFDPYKVEDVKMAIHEKMGFGYLVRTWIDINRNLFEALFLEKWGLFLILTLMVMVASFNIVSTLVVTVTSKVHDIGIMKAVGVTSRSIRRIFIKQGTLIGLKGTLWGCFLGLSISYILRTYVKVPEEIYSIDRVPVDLELFDVSVIVMAAMIISYLATLYPAAKAASLQPVDALRYE